MSDADLLNYVGHIIVGTGDYTTFTANDAATILNVGLAFNLVGGGEDLFGQLVTRTIVTYTAVGDLTVKLTIQQD